MILVTGGTGFIGSNVVAALAEHGERWRSDRGHEPAPASEALAMVRTTWRLVYASSAATYGDGANGFSDADDGASLARLRPFNAYGWSTHAFDRWVVREVLDGAPQPPHWADLKLFNVHGPNEYHKEGMMSVVTKSYATPEYLVKTHRARTSRRLSHAQHRGTLSIPVVSRDSPPIQALREVIRCSDLFR